MLHEIQGIGDLTKVDRGVLDVLFRAALRRVNEDLIDRPALNTGREIILRMTLTPVADESGTLQEVKVEFEIKTKAPVARTREFSMVMGGPEVLRFNDLAPENYRQGTLDEVASRKESAL